MSSLLRQRLALILIATALFLVCIFLVRRHFHRPDPLPRYLVGHSDEVNALAFAADGRLLATAGDNQRPELYQGEIQVWDRKSLVRQQTLVFPSGIGENNQVTFSPDSRRIAGSNDQSISVWDTRTGQLIKNYPMSRRNNLPMYWTSCFALFFRKDGTLLDCEVGGDNAQIVKLWNRSADKQIWRFPNGTEVQNIVVSPNESRIAVTSFDTAWHSQVKLLDARTGKLLRVFSPPHSAFTEMQAKAVCFSPDSRWLALAGQETITVQDVQTGKIIHTLTIACRGPEYPNALAFSPDGAYLAFGTQGQEATFLESIAENSHNFGTLNIWHLNSGKVQTLPGYDGGIDFLTYAPDGRTLWGNNDMAWDAADVN